MWHNQLIFRFRATPSEPNALLSQAEWFKLISMWRTDLWCFVVHLFSSDLLKEAADFYIFFYVITCISHTSLLLQGVPRAPPTETVMWCSDPLSCQGGKTSGETEKQKSFQGNGLKYQSVVSSSFRVTSCLLKRRWIIFRNASLCWWLSDFVDQLLVSWLVHNSST